MNASVKLVLDQTPGAAPAEPGGLFPMTITLGSSSDELPLASAHRARGWDLRPEVSRPFNRVERALQCDNIQLQQRLAGTESALRRANAQLAELARDADELIAAAARDLQTSVHTIKISIAHLETPLRSTGDQVATEYLSRIQSASTRMAELVAELLHLGHPTASAHGTAPVNLSRIAIAHWVGLTTNDAVRQTSLSVASDMVVHGDPVGLSQVVQTLLANALRYTKYCAVQKIEFGHCTGPNGGRAFFVRDSGVWFDTAHAEELFEPLTRVASTAQFSGMGLGLATAARIIRNHGGLLWAQASAEEGVTFYFTIADPAPDGSTSALIDASATSPKA